MNFFEAIKTCFSKYATFTGRARRSEHWYFFLFVTLIQIIIGTWWISTMIGPIVEMAQAGGDPNDTEAIMEIMKSALTSPAFICYVIFWLATLIPTIAVQIRRMHDTSRSGWWSMTYWGGQLLGYVVPIVGSLASIGGAVWFIVLACQDSIPGDNEYGPNPKGINALSINEF